MLLSKLAQEAAHVHGVLRVSPETYKSYRATGRNLIRFFGNVDLEQLAPSDLANWCKDLEKQDISPHTANHYKRVAKAMLNLVGKKPLTIAIKQQRTVPKKSKAMRPEHFDEMIKHANLRDAAILLLLKDSGKRRATIAGLKVAKTKIYQGQAGDFRIVSRSIEKGNKEVLVLGGHQAALSVLLWLDIRNCDSPYIFNNLKSPAPITADRVTKIFNALKMKANIPADVQASPHTLRHWFAQRQLSKFDARIVADWMGITIETLLAVYATRSEDELIRIYYEEYTHDPPTQRARVSY